MVVLVISLCIVNIILWGVFLFNFKKLFSTDKIIEKTADKMNHMVSDIDNTTQRDVYLLNEKTKKLQSMLDEAEIQMDMFKAATQRLREMIAESEKISKKNPKVSPLYQDIPVVTEKKPAEVKGKSQAAKNAGKYLHNANTTTNLAAEKKENKSQISPDDVFEVIKSQEQNLFDDTDSAIISTDTPMNVTEDGAAFKEVPLIITKVYQETPTDNSTSKNSDSNDEANFEKRVEKKKNLNKRVQELYNNGLKVEEIANELSCSITEVQLIIDMNI